MKTLDQIRQARIEKLQKLQTLGINPYPASVKREDMIAEARKKEGKKVAVAGRVMSVRKHGKVDFHDLIDESGEIQIVYKADKIDKEKFSLLEYIDNGDFIQVNGEIGKTQAGEISVFATDFSIITKAIHPLPDVWYGLKDIEERYRKRYVDMILNAQVRERIKVRGQIVQAIRDFLTKKGFIETETPTLQPIYGGGFARPFKTFHNALDANFYLRISDEMYLKRLIVGGFEKVFEITKVFRNEGVDHDHNPEFTMFEAQIAYEDYTYGMDIIEEIIEFTAKHVLGTTQFTYQGVKIDFKRPWQRYKMVEAIEKFTGVNPLNWTTLEQAKKAVKTISIATEKMKELDKIASIGEVIAFVFEHAVEEKLIQPTIIYDFPIEVSPLAKKCKDPRFTQRFEQFVYGTELGNNYTELNDPIDLRTRFIEEKNREKAGFEEAMQTDEDYLTAIEHGFPPTCGIAIGIDRLVMMMTDAKTIKEVIAFPTLRPEKEKNKKLQQDFDQKLVIVIDQKLPAWQIMNTSAHAAAFLGNKMRVKFDTGEYFVTRDGVNLPRNSQYAIVTLSANQEELKKLSKEVRDSGLLYIGYVSEMMETTNDAELEGILSRKDEAEIKYAGIGIFGSKIKVDKLTRKFTLWDKKITNVEGEFHQEKSKPAIGIKTTGAKVISKNQKSSKGGNTMVVNREKAWEILTSNMENKNLIRHCLAVEVVMRALAKHFGEDEEVWGVVGLLHDGDYEKTKDDPKQHTILMAQWLKDAGETNQQLIEAILSHNYAHTGENLPADATHQALQAGPPKNNIEWSLYCCDELTGLIVAVTLVRPEKKIADVSYESIMKKWKNESFAAGVHRPQIAECEARLGIPLKDFIELSLKAMQGIASEIGL